MVYLNAHYSVLYKVTKSVLAFLQKLDLKNKNKT